MPAEARERQRERRSGPAAAVRVDDGAVHPTIASPALELLDLQRLAGNRAVRGMVAGIAGSATPRPPFTSVQRDDLPPQLAPADVAPSVGGAAAHPLLKYGRRGPDVMELQSKLNLAGASPELAADGIFGPKTAAAVKVFQRAHSLVVDGIVGLNTWGALDLQTIGQQIPITGGQGPAGGSQPGTGQPAEPASPTATGVGTMDTGEGEPQAIAIGSIHPVLRPGMTGSAVSELQHKLNIHNFLLKPTVAVTAVYDAPTVAAVLVFKAAQTVIEKGNVGLMDVGPATWAELDRVSPGSPVGRVEKEWGEVVAGKKFKMVSRYTYHITQNPNQIQITVRIGFSGDLSFVPRLLSAIKMTWNRFSAERTDDADPHEQVPIVFNPLSDSANPDNSVQLLHSPNPNKPARSDASHWFVDDKDRLSYLAAHEFGHMIGLEDEYQRSHVDYMRVVGEPPSGAPLPAADTAATQLRKALFMPADASPIPLIGPIIDLFGSPKENRYQEARRVANNWNLANNRRAAFDVAVAYDSKFGPPAGGPDLITAIQQQLATDRHLDLINVFTFTTLSTMGVPPTMNADVDGNLHAHPLNPRHVRQFVKYVEDFRGGKWAAKQTT